MTASDAETLDDAAEAVHAERQISPIAGRRGAGTRGKALAVVALAAGSGLFLLATARHPAAKAAEAVLAPVKQVVAFEPAQGTAEAPTLAHPGPNAPALDGTPSAAGEPRDVAPRAAARGAVAAPSSPPIVVYSRGQGNLATPLAGAATASPAPGLPPQRSMVSAIHMVQATRLPDRKFLIVAGTSIPCVLQTAIDSSTPGEVSCLIPTNVYSDDGTVVLLEKGTRVLGAYGGGLRQGQTRLFVVWTRAVTPAGVAIDLASPAADALGRAGFDGTIDTHFWSRFGGSILLSVIDGGLGALGRAGRGVNVQAPSATADTALKGSIAIAPTLRKAPGAEVSILVAQDLDFSGVYGVRTR